MLEFLINESMVTCLIVASIVVLYLAHAVCLGAFFLDWLFDTSMSTAGERAQTLGTYIAYVVAIQLLILILVLWVVLRWTPPGGAG